MTRFIVSSYLLHIKNQRSIKILNDESHDFNAFRAFIYVLFKKKLWQRASKKSILLKKGVEQIIFFYLSSVESQTNKKCNNREMIR